jgi:heptosyltransferase-2
MSRILIVKLGAAGDVVRTTPVLRRLGADEVDWFTAPEHAPLLAGAPARILTDPACLAATQPYDLVLSLEESAEALGSIFAPLRFRQVIGTYPGADGAVHYTSEMRDWYDMSLVSTLSRRRANHLKWRNRRSYQDILFAALGQVFDGEPYLLPRAIETNLRGDVALIAAAGGRWPNKRWGHCLALARRVGARCKVNILPWRRSPLEHLSDLRNHALVIAPDSLPMHFALGLGKPTLGIFNCTSPWEIHPYGRLRPQISPGLERYFYATEFDEAATLSLPLETVLDAVATELRWQVTDRQPAHG